MVDVVLDRAVIAQLLEVKDYLRIRDPNGQLLGFYLPQNNNTTQLLLALEPDVTTEELERRRNERGGKTLAEFWAEMRQKYPDKF